MEMLPIVRSMDLHEYNNLRRKYNKNIKRMTEEIKRLRTALEKTYKAMKDGSIGDCGFESEYIEQAIYRAEGGE